MKNCALVIRVSDPRQGDEPDKSPDNQRQQLDSYIAFKNADALSDPATAEKHTLKVFKEYRLVGVPGKDSFDSPQFDELRRDVKTGHIQIVMATGLDRFGRNVQKFLKFFEFLHSKKVDLVVTHYQIDTATDVGRLIMTILMALAEMHSLQLSKKIIGSRHSLLEKKGLKSGGSIPLGYVRHPDRKGLFVLIESEAAVVRLIFRLYIDLKNLAEVARRVNMEGYRTKQTTSRKGKVRGGDLFTADNIRYILENWIYIGVLEEHKKNRGQADSDIAEDKRYHRYFPTDTEAWPKIIDDDTFHHVQNLLSIHAVSNKAGARRTYPYVLSGMVFCSMCDGIMDADKGKETHHYYSCKNKDCPGRLSVHTKFPRLKRNSIEASILESAAKRLITDTVLNSPIVISKITTAANETLQNDLPALKKEMHGLKVRLNDLEARKKGIQVSLGSSSSNARLLKQSTLDLSAVMDEICEVEASVAEKQREIARSARETITEVAVRRALEALASEVEVIPPHQQKDLLHLLFDRITVGLEEIEAHLSLDAVLYLARKGPDPSSFDWTQGWYARQDLNPEPSGP